MWKHSLKNVEHTSFAQRAISEMYLPAVSAAFVDSPCSLPDGDGSWDGDAGGAGEGIGDELASIQDGDVDVA